jgi:NTE family protein
MGLSNLPRPIGYVLGGGGSLGAAQVGMLQALGEHEVAPDLVVGTSVGSLNGAVVARDPSSAANRLAHAWVRMTKESVFPGGIVAQIRTLQQSKTYVFPNTGLAAVIDDFIGAAASFDDLTLPFAAVAMDVATARPHLLREGLLRPALLASCAIPGVYPRVDLGALRLYDGGVVANVPMRQAVEMGARSLVVLDCGFPGQLPDIPESLADVLMFTMTVTMRNQAVLEAPTVAADIPVVYLPGPAWRPLSPLDFGHTDALIEAAYEAARTFLADLTPDRPGLYGSPSI